MKALICIALTACLAGGCTTDRSRVAYEPDAARSRIVSAFPAKWRLVPPDAWQKGTIDRYFTTSGSDAFILLGPQRIYSDLNDRAGSTHREYLWKECLYVWVVPGDFEPKFGRTTIYNFFDPPWHPHPVFASRSVKVYAEPGKYILDTNRMDELFRQQGYGTSPQEFRLSWKSWRPDIAASLRE
jgi:hypothetical protein